MLNSQKTRREQGFTLVELLIVVLIIGILATIAIPVFNGQRAKAKNAATQTAVRTAVDAASAFYADGETYNTLDAAKIHSNESSISATAESNATTVGTGTPTSVYVTAPSAPVVSPYTAAAAITGTAGTANGVIICSAGKGDKSYCARLVNGVVTYSSASSGSLATLAALGTSSSTW